MAVVEFINKPNKTYTGMRKIINYVLRPDKTNETITTGINLNPDNAFNEMVTLKKLMGKTDRRLWYHFIQSFPPYDNIKPELAMQVAIETAEYFKEQYQILIAVHTDKKHIHTHFLLNTVNIETGKKYTQNNEQRIEIQAFSDRICEKYNLHVLSEAQRNNGNYKKPGQYRAEQAGKSWKAELKVAVDDVLSTAVSRADFIRKMKAEGYQVKWSDTRENITFTMPTGMRCRDRRIGEPEYYNKHNFEMIFEQNAKSSHGDFTPFMQPLFQNFAGLFGGDNEQPISSTFGDIDFEGKSWKEIEEILARLYSEAETRKARALANQNEVEQKEAEHTFRQTVALLDEFEKWLLAQFIHHDYDNDNDVLEI
jgi:hypothetical protein